MYHQLSAPQPHDCSCAGPMPAAVSGLEDINALTICGSQMQRQASCRKVAACWSSSCRLQRAALPPAQLQALLGQAAQERGQVGRGPASKVLLLGPVGCSITLMPVHEMLMGKINSPGQQFMDKHQGKAVCHISQQLQPPGQPVLRGDRAPPPSRPDEGQIDNHLLPASLHDGELLKSQV